MLSVGFEPRITAGEQPQTHTLDRAATGTDILLWVILEILVSVLFYILTAIYNDNKSCYLLNPWDYMLQ